MNVQGGSVSIVELQGTIPTIGGPIVGGTPGSVLFIGPNSVFAQDPVNFRWDYNGNNLKINNGLDFQGGTATFTIIGTPALDYGVSSVGAWTFSVPINSPNLTGFPTAPTVPSGVDSTTKIATTAFVQSAIAAVSSGVTNITVSNGISGGGSGLVNIGISANGVLNASLAQMAAHTYKGNNTSSIATPIDVTAAQLMTDLGAAPLASPALTGTPTAPTATAGTNSTQLATTSFVATSFAPLVSPALTGTPTAPTAVTGISNTQLATTAYVQNSIGAIASGVTNINVANGLSGGGSGNVTIGISANGILNASLNTMVAHTYKGNNTGATATPIDVTAAQLITDIGAAPLASPTFTGIPAAPTAAPGTSTTQIATTSFVATSFAPLASPALTGTPTAPTVTPATDSTTKLATTAFVQNAVAAVSAGVTNITTTSPLTGGGSGNVTIGISSTPTFSSETLSSVGAALNVYDTGAVVTGVGGQVNLQANNTTSTETTYSAIKGYGTNGNPGAETGDLQVLVRAAGTLSPWGRFVSNGRLLFGTGQAIIPGASGTLTLPATTDTLAAQGWVSASYAPLASPTFTGTVTASIINAPAASNLAVRAATGQTLVLGVASGGSADIDINASALFPSVNNVFNLGSSTNVFANGWFGALKLIGTSGNTTLVASNAASGTLTLPAVTDTIATLTTPTFAGPVTINNTGASGGNSLIANRWSADGNAPVAQFQKSRGASVGAHAIVSSGDDLGQINWYGDDGVNFRPAAVILANADGAWTAGTSSPGKLFFQTTPSGSISPVTRLTINNTGTTQFTHDALTADTVTVTFASTSPGWRQIVQNLNNTSADNAGARYSVVTSVANMYGLLEVNNGVGGAGTVTLSSGAGVTNGMTISTGAGPITLSPATTVTAPTAVVGDNDTSVATTAFVQTAIAGFCISAARYGVAAGNSAAANNTALTSAITAAAAFGGCEIRLPPGIIDITPFTITTTNSVTFVGLGMNPTNGGTTLRFNNATGNCITWVGGSFGGGLRNLCITSSVKMTSDFAVYISANASAVEIENVFISNVFDGIWVSDSSETVISNVELRYLLGIYGILGKGTVGNGVYGWRIDHLICDNPYPSTLVYPYTATWAISTAFTLGKLINNNGNIYQCTTAGTSAGVGTGPSGIPGTTGVNAFTTTIIDGTAQWKFVCSNSLIWIDQDSYAYSLTIQKSACIDGAYGFTMKDAANTGSSYPTWAECFDLETDHNYFAGVSLEAGTGLYDSSGWHGSVLDGNGVQIISPNRGDNLFTQCHIVGNWQHGILINSGPINTSIVGGGFYLNSQQAAGLFHNVATGINASGLTVTGAFIGKGPEGSGQAGYGVFINTGNTNVIINGNVTVGNATGGINVTSSGSIVVVNNL